ncbi:uncharacterized protein LOC131329970 [Rhododendron vialii]|uniref:uncharacterized protein LOC131329970 n=1 Tax=Rhododendron vialii TaxID=182163 RepID=UPI00265DCC89|nr:uncharacterized protein LOC131329970 [Rhododendron vialii]
MTLRLKSLQNLKLIAMSAFRPGFMQRVTKRALFYWGDMACWGVKFMERRIELREPEQGNEKQGKSRNQGSYLDEEFCHRYEDQGGLTGLRWGEGPCSGRKERLEKVCKNRNFMLNSFMFADQN